MRGRTLGFAHIVGLPERLDPLPGQENREESSSRKYSTPEANGIGAVRVSFREDERVMPLQRALLRAVQQMHHSYIKFRRLWLPKNNIATKCPYFKQAFAHPEEAVMLDGSTQRMLRAKREGRIESQNMAYRPKPKFRTGEPGFKTILAFNLAFIYWLMFGSL